jgi:hypothetical protein
MNPNPKPPQRPVEAPVLRTLLDAEAASLDAATLSRLNRARQSALDAGLKSGVRRWRTWTLALPAVACAVLAIWLLPALTPPVVDAGAELADLEALLVEPVAVDGDLLSSGAPLELIDEWEFYAWLEQQPDAERG